MSSGQDKVSTRGRQPVLVKIASFVRVRLGSDLNGSEAFMGFYKRQIFLHCQARKPGTETNSLLLQENFVQRFRETHVSDKCYEHVIRLIVREATGWPSTQGNEGYIRPPRPQPTHKQPRSNPVRPEKSTVSLLSGSSPQTQARLATNADQPAQPGPVYEAIDGEDVAS